ncbi:hypothetical protein P4576_00005, partial [Peribacillus frigoritolerans]|uniref:hypothetical protein n=1 Tax=Peribacillus frigoritolerans TaxID=450367 RepID=UPI002E1EA11C|nr:hypothetical protein [Peribacillus frigoritolerans]
MRITGEKNLKDNLVLNLVRNRPAYSFFKKTFQLIPEIRSLSADCLPSLLGVSACGVSARQYFGRSVAYFFHPMRITGEKNLKDNLVLNLVRNRPAYSFFKKTFQLIS